MIVFHLKNMNSIKNKKEKGSCNGFTIIELLVVISIMVILGIIFTNILVDALRGRNKVKAINQVKQNGQVVMDKLSNEIRDADGIVCVDKYSQAGSTPKNTLVIANGGTYTQFRLIPPDLAASPPTNGKIQKMTFIRNDIPNGTSEPSLCTNFDLVSGTNFKQSLTDIDPTNGVSVDYTPKSGGGYENIFDINGNNIIIKFNALAGVSAGYAYDVTVAEGGIPFSTSVQVRGIRR